MNTLFDVTYLRYADPRFREAVSEPLILEDVAIWNYLNNSVRPEKNLEALSRLFGFIPLAHSATKKFRRYDRVDDPDLLHYNAADSELALKLRAHLRRQLDRDASSEYARRYFSDLLWSCIEMTEAGVAFDSDELCKLLGRCENTKQKTSHFTVKAGYGPLHGPGSPATASRIVREAVEIAGLATDKRLKRTKQRGLVSTEKDNIQLLRGAVKIITSYVKPLLPRLAKDRKQLLIDGIAYPQYYPAPQSYGEAGGGVVEGGTVQARPTCKQPALQTAPESVQLCFTSRHMPGALLKIDLSQIELRLAAFLSGDKKMLAEYRAGADRHALMAIAFFGPDIVNKPDFKKWRQVGKQGRFWQIYRGGPRILQEQVRRRCGVELPFEQCCDFERQLPQENPDLYEWQEEQIRSTTRLGYVTAPILGDRRWLSRSQCVNQTTYESTICNFPIQVTAARLMMDLQAGLRRHAKTLRGVITLNIFDAIYIDCPLAEERMWPKIFRTALHRSTFWRKLQTETGRSIPLGFDTTIRRFLPCNSY
jgi:DNA polymerase I-like protein with 3'-5' exonuclease and polymerase domains